MFALVGAVEELSIEQLDADHSEDELEEKVDDENVEHVLQGDDDAIEDCLQLRNSVDGLNVLFLQMYCCKLCICYELDDCVNNNQMVLQISFDFVISQLAFVWHITTETQLQYHQDKNHLGVN